MERLTGLGPRVIGQEAYEREQRILQNKVLGRLGPRVTQGRNPYAADGEAEAEAVEKREAAAAERTAKQVKEARSLAEAKAQADAETVAKAIQTAKQKRPHELGPRAPGGVSVEVGDLSIKDVEATSLSVKEVQAELESNPASLDRLIAAELNRPAGARKTALRALIAAENARDGGPRADFIERLQEKL